jgi:ABC-2 type transport system permease protein
MQQTNYQWKIFLRTPIAAFFTLVFPLLLLVLFGAIFGNEDISDLGVTIAQYFAPALAVFSAANATYSNIGVGTAYQRDEGILKRVRGAPLPPWIFFGGKIIASTLVAAIATVIMMAVGVFGYGITIYPRTLPAAIVTFAVGTACFAGLGLLVAAVSPTGNAATAISNATLLPLAFLSGLFFPTTEDTPTWMVTIGDIFPLKHFNDAFQAAFLPGTTGAQFDWGALGYMTLWGLVAVALAIRFFHWEPRQTTRQTRTEKVAAS